MVAMVLSLTVVWGLILVLLGPYLFCIGMLHSLVEFLCRQTYTSTREWKMVCLTLKGNWVDR